MAPNRPHLDPKPLRFHVKILQKRVPDEARVRARFNFRFNVEFSPPLSSTLKNRVPAEARVRAGCNFLISSWIFLTLVKHSPPKSPILPPPLLSGGCFFLSI